MYTLPHPGLAPTPTEVEWTRDMDDMLRLHLRRSGFDFEAASQQLQELRTFMTSAGQNASAGGGAR